MESELKRGVIERLVGETLGYLREETGGKTYSFTPEAIENYKGQGFENLGINEQSQVGFILDASGDVITKIVCPADRLKQTSKGNREPGLPVARSFTKLQQFDPRFPDHRQNKSESGVSQMELQPSVAPTASKRAGRALPLTTRNFGKLVDTRPLKAGDLLLTRDLRVESWVSTNITEVQGRGGYGLDDAKWTHAAMYLGDEENVVEATIDSPLSGGNVRITSLDEYCDGMNILRFRRSHFIQHEKEGWRVCVRALSRLGKPYSLSGAFKLWYDVKVRGGGFYDANQAGLLSTAILCSTLYADSFNEATRRTLGEINGICVPAWLSATEDFFDLEVGWLGIA